VSESDGDGDDDDPDGDGGAAARELRESHLALLAAQQQHDELQRYIREREARSDLASVQEASARALSLVISDASLGEDEAVYAGAVRARQARSDVEERALAARLRRQSGAARNGNGNGGIGNGNGTGGARHNRRRSSISAMLDSGDMLGIDPVHSSGFGRSPAGVGGQGADFFGPGGRSRRGSVTGASGYLPAGGAGEQTPNRAGPGTRRGSYAAPAYSVASRGATPSGSASGGASGADRESGAATPVRASALELALAAVRTGGNSRPASGAARRPLRPRVSFDLGGHTAPPAQPISSALARAGATTLAPPGAVLDDYNM
jgi:hypothetical protein